MLLNENTTDWLLVDPLNLLFTVLGAGKSTVKVSAAFELWDSASFWLQSGVTLLCVLQGEALCPDPVEDLEEGSRTHLTSLMVLFVFSSSELRAEPRAFAHARHMLPLSCTFTPF